MRTRILRAVFGCLVVFLNLNRGSSGPFLSPLQGFPVYPKPTFQLACSHDGAFVAISRERIVSIWQGHPNNLLNSKRHNDEVLAVACNPQMPQFVLATTTGPNHILEFYDLPGGELKQSIYTGHKDVIMSVDFSPDGQLVASGSRDGTVRLWSNSTKRQLFVLMGHNDWVEDVAFSPNGLILATSGLAEEVRLWDTRTGKCVATLSDGHHQGFSSLAFNGTGRLLAAGARDGLIQLWDVEDWKLIAHFRSHAGAVESLSFNSNSTFLASGGMGGTIRIWDMASRSLLTEANADRGTVWVVMFHPTKKDHLISAGRFSPITLWHLDYE